MHVTLTQDSWTSIIGVDEPLACLSWAPYVPGDGALPVFPVYKVINRTLAADEYIAGEGIQDFCRQCLADGGHDASTSIVLLTTVQQTRLQHQSHVHKETGLRVEVFCTAGLGNALAPGDPTLYDEECGVPPAAAGTINLIVLVNRQLTPSALLELLQVVVMAKCQALYRLDKKSSVTHNVALGTGTDCLVVGGLANADLCLHLAGMHTKLGECVGRVVCQTVWAAIYAQQVYMKQLS